MWAIMIDGEETVTIMNIKIKSSSGDPMGLHCKLLVLFISVPPMPTTVLNTQEVLSKFFVN